MFTVEHVLADLYPEHKPAGWQLALLRRLLHEKEFQQFDQQYRHLQGLDMVEQVLEYFDIRCDTSERDLEQIPSTGPVVIVANHPLGSLDGLALLHAVSQVRRDVKIVTNRLLGCLRSLQSLMVPVDNMSNRTNRQQVALMQEQLDNQGVLIFFPAGEVSRLGSKGIRDGKWSHGFVRLAARSRAPVVPVHVSGRNSSFFYATSALYQPLSTMLLVNEMFGQRGNRLKLQIGERIPFSHWYDGHTPAKELAARFRRHVYRIGQGKSALFQTEAAIARAEDRAVLKKALADCEVLGQLPDGKIIYLYRRNGEAYVPILRELGRLREIAFRAVGEGSGTRRDLDDYDDDYYHLILWDDEALDIVGAYRFIPTAGQVSRKGLAGLYSYSLFNYDHEMNPILDRGIELGRSFIQPAYWGKRGLDYLWMGIGAYLAKYPQYRYLFGPVSISGGLPLAARDLLVAFYRLYFAPTLPLAQSRRPYPASLPAVLAQFSGDDYQEDLRRLKRLLSNLGTAIPPLYKQYSELCEPGGVQFIDFGSDPDFNNCIDGLVLVDISQLKESRFQRYIAVHQPAIGPSDC
ncbi:GNAT family N-acetyltransferase [Erwinia sp. OLTSP20]|uniref:lysophospholipid acyltransferase family protein n=1 Tax=unclassified Erwinia TaxID=2622719 RepID=UPI000C19CDC0|nr:MULTISPECIES: GNAT family N-acyltransferase [unclassified Erwinia]PIJ50307.1 GNAT family N-acetyltransferase [Erwinia sp. OAMSP11]PIJ72145.1 GNAT family N-acetyltransferase [Erwinia sp. OLSSP12]PIJ81436.1 GNAT family N-acetyltransferase [Erwinia sp. OLCASP19]PIJ84142.1 GNAT family N-acetyltransferase [Erwinia sp. OLMTSP26]PIJ85841.1 GNAT family N-acetyltransferase [Erwinia sp. OLMDSP33]